VNECINAYLKLSKEVFRVDQVLLGKIPVGDNQCRFDHNVLEAVIKTFIKDRNIPEDICMSAVPKATSDCCPTFVIAKRAVHADGPPTVFRSYAGEGVGPSKCAVWEAARATSAAPSFFKEMYIDNPRPGVNYIDGGLGHNNPSQVALDEAARIWPTSKNFCLVSIGTGRQRAVRIIDIPKWMNYIEEQRSLFEHVISFVPNVVSIVPGWKTAKNFPPGVLAVIKMTSALLSLVTDSEDVHDRLRRTARANDIDKIFPYFRFNVDRDVGDIGLEEWKRAEEIQAHTDSYLAEQAVEDEKTKCVKCLIKPPQFKCK